MDRQCREVHIIGGGLAGCEAAWQVARAGGRAVLYEMRPLRQTPAHKTGDLAELVCSNSLKSEQQNSAPWLLKEELRRLGSLLIGEIAPRARVPAGHALTVDRDLFAAEVTRAIEAEPAIEIRREEVTHARSRSHLDHRQRAADFRCSGGGNRARHRLRPPVFLRQHQPDRRRRIDRHLDRVRASRYGKSLDGTDDYLNCPFDKAQYEAFLDALLAAESVPAHIGEDHQSRYFEACLPDRRNRAAGTRHAALRADEADGTDRSAHRPPALRCGSTSPGRRARGQLQPGGIPESHALRRSAARAAHDPGPRKRRVPALRTGASQHLYQRTRAADADAPVAHAPGDLLRGTDFGRRRICRIDRHGSDRRTRRGGVGGGRDTARVPARDRHGIAVRLRVRSRSHPTISPRISPSICCRSWKTRRAIESCGTRKYAAERWPRSKNTCTPMSELAIAIDRYLAELRRKTPRAHTLRNYASDLEQFAGYFSPPGQIRLRPRPSTLRYCANGWAVSTIASSIPSRSAASWRRCARCSSFCCAKDPCQRMSRAPGADSQSSQARARGAHAPSKPTPHRRCRAKISWSVRIPSATSLIFELLYGCGLRISELVGLDLDDFDLREHWIRVRGKGRKERQVPYGAKAPRRSKSIWRCAPPSPARNALFVNHRGTRLSDRGARGIVKFYARMISGDASLHPHSLRHAFATHLARRRRGSARDSGTAGPRAPGDHAEIHASVADGFDGGVRQSAPEGARISSGALEVGALRSRYANLLAFADERRHLHHQTGFGLGGLRYVRNSRALQARLGFDHCQVDSRGSSMPMGLPS